MWKKRFKQAEYKNENDTIWNLLYELENDKRISVHKTRTLYEIRIMIWNVFILFETKRRNHIRQVRRNSYTIWNFFDTSDCSAAC